MYCSDPDEEEWKDIELMSITISVVNGLWSHQKLVIQSDKSKKCV